MALRSRRHPVAEEESYFVSMTDVLVGLLFLFIIMLMAFALQYRRAEVEKTTQTRRILSADELAHEAKGDILRAVSDYLRKHGVTVEIDERQGVLRLPEEMLFAKARAELSDDGRRALARVAQGLALVLPCYVPERGPACADELKAHVDAVFVEGHTDADPMLPGARYRDNLELSTARAANTWRALMGIDAPGAAADAPPDAELYAAPSAAGTLMALRNRDGRPVVSVSGYGDQRPVAENLTEEGKRANRRIDLRLLMATLRPEELERIERDLQMPRTP
jgi:flagellar motor protein MotB